MRTVFAYLGVWVLLTLSGGFGSLWRTGRVDWLEYAAYAAIGIAAWHFWSTTTTKIDVLERKVRNLEAINKANYEARSRSYSDR